MGKMGVRVNFINISNYIKRLCLFVSLSLCVFVCLYVTLITQLYKVRLESWRYR